MDNSSWTVCLYLTPGRGQERPEAGLGQWIWLLTTKMQKHNHAYPKKKKKTFTKFSSPKYNLLHLNCLKMSPTLSHLQETTPTSIGKWLKSQWLRRHAGGCIWHNLKNLPDQWVRCISCAPVAASCHLFFCTSRVWSRSHVDGGRQGSECDGAAEGQAGRSGSAAKSKQI